MSTKRVSDVEKTSTLIVQEDPETGEAFIELPDRILRQLGWKEGDSLQWIERPDGSWTIQKVEENDENKNE